VLIDLGLARPMGAPPGGHRRGSPPWMAPEQVRRRPASPGMDLFALGAVLYELATGTPAFDPAGGPATTQVLALVAAAMPADAEEDRLWPTWATGRLTEWQASTMERPPLVPRPA
jgi:eukaryotic-like serine/threonine-protein kinase